MATVFSNPGYVLSGTRSTTGTVPANTAWVGIAADAAVIGTGNAIEIGTTNVYYVVAFAGDIVSASPGNTFFAVFTNTNPNVL